ncbi:MAG: tetratricopeptide repeat protein, partial [Desulfobacteraceae bacterium]|nr:tetratricopeptide repeat protein [Desulfobacteraceae bacterium]
HPQEQAGQDAKQVWLAYGQRYEAIFWALQQSGESGSREAATEMGRRALTYVVRAGAYDELGSFAGELVISTRNPRQLQAIIAELQRIVEQVPQGETRWSVRTYLADALGRSDQPEQSLSFYEQSANEAESARNWSDVGWICQNWAIAFTISGRLVQAREVYMRSANAKRKGDMPEINIIGSELEAFRIDVMQGKAKETLPEIEDRLDKIRDWWERHGKGETIAEVPDAELLARVFIGGLDIAEDATRVLENWLDCLNLLQEIETVKRSRGESEYEIARTRFNQYGPLMRLGRLSEAQAMLEGCLQVFRDANELTTQSTTLSALANIWKERGDLTRAIDLERQALSVKERMDDSEIRAISHGNLSSYLYKDGQTEESANHTLARIIYNVVTGNQQLLGTVLRNLSICMKQNAQYRLPRLSTLLSNPQFTTLRRFLEQRNIVDEGELQEGIDGILSELGL